MAMATLTIAGCSQNEIVETAQPGNEAVGFSVYSGVHTRAVVTDYAAIQGKNVGFGVVALTDGNVLHMKDTNVKYSSEGSAGWKYSPLIYWPNDGSSLSFYAFAPYNGADISKGASSADFESTTAPSVTLTLQTPKKMVDLVAAKAENKTSENGAVSLLFAHVLSRVALKAHTSVDDASTTVKITGLKIIGKTANSSSLFYKSAKYDIKNDSWTLADEGKQGDDWTIIADASSEDTYPAIAVTNTAASILGDNEYLFLIPVGTTTAVDAIKMELTYTVTTGGITTTTTKTLSFTSGSGFLQKGTAYAIDFEITLNAISFTVDETGWAWGSDTPVSPAP